MRARAAVSLARDENSGIWSVSRSPFRPLTSTASYPYSLALEIIVSRPQFRHPSVVNASFISTIQLTVLDYVEVKKRVWGEIIVDGVC